MASSASAGSGEPQVVWQESVGSTNAEAQIAIASGVTGAVWFAAGEQTAGRGRVGREWTSPPGNLYASLLLPVAGVAVDKLPSLALVAGLAVADSFVAAGVSAPVSLKWPNDVLVDQRKCAGILIETSGKNADLRAVIGCGLNLANHPDVTRWPATHLNAHRREMDPQDMLRMLVATMSNRLEQWDRANALADIVQDWTQRTIGIGSNIRLESGEEGTFEGLDETGALLMRKPDGALVTHHGGDVDWLDAKPEQA